jgi:hypothetical protein
MIVFAKQSGLFPQLGEYLNVGSEPAKGKTTPLGICGIRRLNRTFVAGAARRGFLVLAPHVPP